MAAETTGAAAVRSSNPADSYIGSLISLTSKSEIRYEGVLYNINTDESSIGLKNVRSFGTEGRKKDGPQIPPSDKVYEYILFRGSDIKDLQVKSSPPVQPAPPPASINNDPAIIQQSHYPRPATAPTSLPTLGTGVSSLSDVGSHNVQMGLTGSNYQGGLPFYQPGGSLGTWGAASPAPPPNGNGSGMAMPMYWPGYYGPSTGLPHLHQQPMLRPPLGVSMPPPMQPPMQLPNYSVPFPSGASNLPSSNLPSSNLPGSNLLTPNWPGSSLPVPNLATSLPDMPSLVPSSTGSLNFVSTTSSPVTLVPPIASDTLPSLMPNKASRSAPPAANLTTPLPTLSPLTTSTTELSALTPPIHSNPSATSGPAMPNQATGQSISSTPIASSSLRTETPTHTLVTLGQLVQSGPATVSSSQSVQAVHKDVEVVQVSSSSPPEPLITVSAEALPPILPLPAPSRPAYKPNGAPYYNRHGYRGHERGRGTGSSRPVAKFTEDFDFEAMNEKFNKDEVWGHLGKSKHARDKDDGNVSDDDFQDEYDDEDAKVDSKAVYNKDDFFDTLSCNTLGNNPQNGRPRFSEQIKLDTETFGEFSRYRGGRGGRGPPRGGRSRGSYHGRGYGYGNNSYGNGSGNNGYGNGSGNGYTGRGRGRAMPSRTA